MVMGLSGVQLGLKSYELFIKSMVTDRVGRHDVLLPINHKSYREKRNSKVTKERKKFTLKD